ncbi:unnamed protein product, partial [Hapterophycus canaliculatus]
DLVNAVSQSYSYVAFAPSLDGVYNVWSFHTSLPPPDTTLSETRGTWVDRNGNNRSDVGEPVSLTVVVTNKGTVKLESISISDMIDSTGCTTSEPIMLEQGEQYEC